VGAVAPGVRQSARVGLTAPRGSGAAVLEVTVATASVLCIFEAPLDVSATNRKVSRYGVRKCPSGSPTRARTRDLRINSTPPDPTLAILHEETPRYAKGVVGTSLPGPDAHCVSATPRVSGFVVPSPPAPGSRDLATEAHSEGVRKVRVVFRIFARPLLPGPQLQDRISSTRACRLSPMRWVDKDSQRACGLT
jgi:hypothetical protein